MLAGMLTISAIGRRRGPACHIFASLSRTFDFFGAGNPSFRDFKQRSLVFR
jgi:hypothetical protein